MDRIGLRLHETGGVKRLRWPVTLGVPFPRGWLARGDDVRLVEQPKAPLQTRPLAYWPDGSVRWLLVDLQADLEPRQELLLHLEKGNTPPADVRIEVDEDNAGVRVQTGALLFTVAKKEFSPFFPNAVSGEKITAKPMRGFIETVTGRAAALAPDSVEVVEKGPLRTRIAIAGRYENGFRYRIRIDAYAGLAFVRILHTFIDATDESYTMVRRIGLDLPVAIGKYPRYYADLLGTTAEIGVLPEAGLHFLQTSAQSFNIGSARRPGKLGGWFELEGDDAAVGIHVPFMWQEYPQGVRLQKTGLAYDMRADTGPAAKIGIGAAKTHELVLVIGTREAGRTRPSLLRRPAHSVVAHAEPAWIAASGALQNAVDPKRDQALVRRARQAFDRYVRGLYREKWDDAGTIDCPPPEKQEPRKGFFGMLNWGDWNFPDYHDDTKGCDAWGNQEYDTTQALALLFAATGDPKVFSYLIASARHYSDVDVIHHLPKEPGWVGMNHPKNPLHFSFERGGVDPGHTWLEGLLSYHFLTGDDRAREIALGIAEFFVRRDPEQRRGNPRQFGWPALALAAAYDATGESHYRDAALQYAHRGMRLYPAKDAGSHWKMGILADGVAYVHAITADADCAAWLYAYAAAIVEKQPKDARFYPALAYLARQPGNAGYRAPSERAVDRLRFGSWGKPFTVATRTAFRITSLLGGLSPSAPAKATASPSTPAP